MFFNRLVLTTLLALLPFGHAWADRVKDLASVAAGRSNQLIGFGLVVGLQGTGDGELTLLNGNINYVFQV